MQSPLSPGPVTLPHHARCDLGCFVVVLFFQVLEGVLHGLSCQGLSKAALGHDLHLSYPPDLPDHLQALPSDLNYTQIVNA